MIAHKSLTVSILFALIIFTLGSLSVIFLSEVWAIKEVNWSLSNNIFSSYLICVIITYFLFHKFPLRTEIRNNFFFDTNFYGKTSSIAIYLLFASSYLILFFGYVAKIPLPFSNFFLMGIFLGLILAIVQKRYLLSYLILFLAILLFTFSGNRANILFVFLVFFFSSNFSSIKVFFIALITLTVMLSISFLRSDNVFEVEIFEVFITAFGSEWRDGILAHDMFSSIEIDNAKSFFQYNFITFLPGWSYIIDPQVAYESQLQTYLVDNLGLSKFGYTGVRIGLIWEAYVLYGYQGVVFLGIITGFLLLVSQFLLNNGGFFIGSIIGIAVIYSLVGFPLYIVSNFGQLIFFYIFIKVFIVMLVKSN